MEQVSLVAEDAGSTGVVAILQGNSLTVAHAGDSRATLRRRGLHTQLTADHSPNRDDEAKRIQRAGGKVFFGRVNGRLAVCILSSSCLDALPCSCILVSLDMNIWALASRSLGHSEISNSSDTSLQSLRSPQ
jgi:hypothetical protein